MIAWKRSGTRFTIKDRINFTSKVLPKYYKYNRLASFSRQLRIYGFYRASYQRRKKEGKNASALTFAHPYFKRDKIHSFHLIQRMSGSYNQSRVKLSNFRVNTVTKSISDFSSTSPALSLSPLMKSQPVSRHNGESKHTVVPDHAFPDYTLLTQEEINPNKSIEFCNSILHEPLILEGVNFTNCPDLSSLDISVSLYSSSTSSFSWETISSSLYENLFSNNNYNHY
ncbi:stress-responsive transcription factor hsf1 [Basidiobolus ranarum]